jgi:hypothetical protein
VDRHRVLQHVVGHVCIHDVEDAVNRLVAARAEYGRPENPARPGVNNGLHQPVRFPLLDGAADATHGTAADEQRPSRGARLALRHADAAERRIDVERVGGHAVAHAPARAVEQVGGNDLVVVVGGVREGPAAPTAAPERAPIMIREPN